jgi:hypothetical protein
MQKLLSIALFCILTLASCQKSDDDNPSTNNPQINIGLWKVTYFRDKDKDETSDFNGYTFDLKSDGTLVANLPGGGTINGTWNQTSTKLIFSITGTYALDEMSDDWLIVSISDTEIRLKDDNDEHLEELRLQKI